MSRSRLVNFVRTSRLGLVSDVNQKSRSRLGLGHEGLVFSELYAKFFNDIGEFPTTSLVAYSFTQNIYLFRIGCSILM